MKKNMKVKNVLMAMVFSVAVLGGYQTYEQVSLTNAESFLLANVEALTEEADVRESHKALALVVKEHKGMGDYESMDCTNSGSPNYICNNDDHLVTKSSSECCESTGWIGDQCTGPLCP